MRLPWLNRADADGGRRRAASPTGVARMLRRRDIMVNAAAGPSTSVAPVGIVSPMGRSTVETVVGGAQPLPPNGDAAFASAHAAVAGDRALQFKFDAPPPPPEPPSWLGAVFEFLTALGPVFVVVFWIGLAVIVLGLLWLIGREIIRIRLPERVDKPLPPSGAGDWRPAPAAALALLSDADALAAEGRFDEAVHLLLLRSIGDIDGHLPNTVRPALTARDIAGLGRLPDAARPAFSRIARAVETSLFGGRSVDRETFLDCRQAYEAFAFPAAWSA